MKLEKREITLNEKDSLLESVYTAKFLLGEYAHAFTQVLRKESRIEILQCIKETGEDVNLLYELAQA